MSVISCPTRSNVTSCIILRETGDLNLPATALGGVFGISVGNSIFVFSRLLQDPTAHVSDTSINPACRKYRPARGESARTPGSVPAYLGAKKIVPFQFRQTQARAHLCYVYKETSIKANNMLYPDG
ncbi:hypothetical protein jhhlp_007454 [Lomentospora prolificans]|uniref:Uncharacterized protein n=1 Tax=Lomentospora prolificans TaxID=41688 RepID=A0A2N3N140_9PEZI|nr:hypothetical protein jhhlp_007454 [Lomentospora prolificans]